MQTRDETNPTNDGGASRQVAILAGGCFWCLEPAFREVRGVLSVESGYTGGTVRNPDYEAVCSGDTGHAEAVRIEFDPRQVSYRELLAVFFGIHDPTTRNRQGHDVGTQYRSAIFVLDEAQRREALGTIARLESGEGHGGVAVFGAPIVTEVVPFTEWFPAESYHQRYYERNPQQGYCSAVISPKLAKFRRQFAALRADAPPRAGGAASAGSVSSAGAVPSAGGASSAGAVPSAGGAPSAGAVPPAGAAPSVGTTAPSAGGGSRPDH